jgi:sodium-dependent dicarboxylate transporter 2/3/5
MSTLQSIQPATRKQFERLKIAFGIILLFLMLKINPVGLDPLPCKVLAIATLMICWWITEALPMPVVALLPLILFPMMGISTVSETAAPYANEVIFLFMGGFMIGLGIEKWGLHKRIALKIVSITGSSGNKILLGFILSTGFISMWLSNTATTMMMYPIAISVISVVLNMNEKDRAKKNFALAMMISIAYASNFGGIATIIGTPPNAAYASYISKKYQVDISFFDWMIVAMPIAILLLIFLFFVLVLVFPNHIKSNKTFENMIATDLDELGPMTVPEKRVLIIFSLTAFLWIFRSLINQLNLVKLDDSMIAVFGAVLLFAVPAGNGKSSSDKLLTWNDTSKMAWGILLLFGGGIALAGALEKSGIIQMIGTGLNANATMTVFSMIVVVAVIALFLSEVMSNVAQVIVFAPIVTVLAETMNINPFLLGIPMTLAASCASMLPMGTPPNAIVFSSGYINIADMVKAGFIMNLIAILLIVIASYYIVPLVMHI